MADIDILCKSLDSVFGHTEIECIQQFTVEDHTDTNHSIVIIFEAEDLLLEVWQKVSDKYDNTSTDKGHNGEIIKCTENGLKVTLTLYKPALKLHIQGDGCAVWKANSFDDIIKIINMDGEVNMDISQTAPKLLVDDTSLSTPNMPELSPMDKYLRRAASCKSKQIQSLERQLAAAHSSIRQYSDCQSGEVNALQKQLAHAKQTIQCLTSTIDQQSKLIDKLLSESDEVTKDMKAMKLESDKLQNDCNKYKNDLIKANTETFFMEDKIKVLKENIANHGKEKNKFLDEIIRQNITFDAISDKLDALVNRVEKTEYVSKQITSENNSVSSETTSAQVNNVTESKTIEDAESYASVLKSAAPFRNACKKDVKGITHNKEHVTEKKADVEITPSKILLIGSSMFKYINRRGLESNVHVSTNRGAKVTDLFRKLQNNSLSMYKSIVIYCGGNDASSGVSEDEFYQEYSDMLEFIRDRYPEMEVILCGLMPRRDVDVTLFNDLIYELCCDYNFQFVDNFKSVFSGNGKLVHNMFNSDGIHVSLKGTAQMLKNMNKHVTIFKARYEHSPKNDSLSENKCFKCNESGHNSANCRHQSVIRCWSCGKSGHKIKHCGTR